MKTAYMLSAVLILSLLFLPIVSAFTWEDYEGTTQWKVAVTEDESDCGGSTKTESYGVSIQHSKQIAEVGNWGHGKTTGAVTGNKLSIPSRTIPDGVGSSYLSDFDITFTSNCMGFDGEYRWDYEDSYMECSGTTKLIGTRDDDDKCPGAEEEEDLFVVAEEIAEARANEDLSQKEKTYDEILAKDPTNFWANWDMAEVKKKQGKYEEFLDYIDQAASNENIFEEIREELKKEAAKSVHLSEYPTPEKSPILRIEMDELNSWNGGLIHNVNFPKEEATNTNIWNIKVWSIYTNAQSDFIYNLAGIEQETE